MPLDLILLIHGNGPVSRSGMPVLARLRPKSRQVMVRVCRPGTPVSTFVKEYRLRQSDMLGSPQRLVFPARTAQFLEFYPADSAAVRTFPSDQVVSTPSATLVGTQAVGRVELFLSGNIRNFTIIFHPNGFYRLFGIPMDELAGRGEDATCFLTPIVHRLNEQLQDSAGLRQMADCAHQFLLPFAERARATKDPAHAAIAWAIRDAAARPAEVRVDDLVTATGLGQRQFERRFKLSIGVSPKHYLRVHRLQHALSLRSDHDGWSWGRVAAEAGYHDQMHLVHDFRALGGEAPSRLYASMQEFRSSEARITEMTMSKTY